MHVLCVHVHVCDVSMCTHVITCGMHVLCVRVHVCGVCPVHVCGVCMHACDYMWCACALYDARALCPCACVCGVCPVHACDYVWYVRAHGFCTLGASAEPLPGDKGLIEGLCSRLPGKAAGGPSPGIFSKRSFLVVTALLLGSDSLGPAGPPENISWGCVLREGGSGWGTVARQPGALSTSGESPDVTRARKDESGRLVST